MIRYICDICGSEIDENGLIYDVNIEVKARYKTLEVNLADLLVDHTEEIKELIEKSKTTDPETLQDSIYKSFEFHLCERCQRRYIKNPLNPAESDIRIDKKRFKDN